MKEDTLKFARVDGSNPRVIYDDEGNPLHPEINDDGIAIYTGSKDFVSRIIMSMPDRLKLYDSPELKCQVYDENGASKWVMMRSWKYEKQSKAKIDPKTGKQAVDPQNGEYLYEKRIVWSETPEVVAPVVETKKAK